MRSLLHPSKPSSRLRGARRFFPAAALAFSLGLTVPTTALGEVRIVAPSLAQAQEKIQFVARAGETTERVAFYVDGKRLWVDNSPSWQFGPHGYMDTSMLAKGQHNLMVVARQRNGAVRRAERRLRIFHRSTTGRGHKRQKPAPEAAPAPAPEPSPTPAPEPAPSPSPAPEPEPSPGSDPAPEPTPAPMPAPAPAPAPSGTVLFRGDFDNGFTGWYVQSLSSRATLSSSGVFEGTKAARFEVRDGDVEPDTGAERSEVSGPTFDEGQDLYIRDAIRIAGSSTYSGPWQIIQQLHEENWSGSPGMALFLAADNSLTLGAGDNSPTFWRSAKLQRDRWYDLVYRVKLSRSSSTGFVEVWLDGAQQSLANGQTRAYGQTIQSAQTYLKAGIYRSKSSTGTSVVEHDAIVVGLSLSAVTGG